MSRPLSPRGSGGRLPRPPLPPPELVSVRTSRSGLGIQLDAINRVIELVKGGQADADGVLLYKGDQVVGCDGQLCGARSLSEVIRPGQRTYLLMVRRADALAARAALRSPSESPPESPPADEEMAAPLMMPTLQEPQESSGTRVQSRVAAAAAAASPLQRKSQLPQCQACAAVVAEPQQQWQQQQLTVAAVPPGTYANAFAMAAAALDTAMVFASTRAAPCAAGGTRATTQAAQPAMVIPSFEVPLCVSSESWSEWPAPRAEGVRAMPVPGVQQRAVVRRRRPHDTVPPQTFHPS